MIIYYYIIAGDYIQTQSSLFKRLAMSFSCLLFLQVLQIAVTEMFLVETHNDPKHNVKPNETDQKGVGSIEEVGALEVGQDYSNGGGTAWLPWDPALMEVTRGKWDTGSCWKCKWKVSSSYCKWVLMLLIKVVDCTDFKAEYYIINFDADA